MIMERVTGKDVECLDVCVFELLLQHKGPCCYKNQDVSHAATIYNSRVIWMERPAV
jgi:hypothetical protein